VAETPDNLADSKRTVHGLSGKGGLLRFHIGDTEEMSNHNHHSTRKAMRAIKALARRHGVSELPQGSVVFTEYRGAPTITERLGDAPFAFIQVGVKGNWVCLARAEEILELVSAAATLSLIQAARRDNRETPSLS
jgi:hypothetical protein